MLWKGQMLAEMGAMATFLRPSWVHKVGETGTETLLEDYPIAKNKDNRLETPVRNKSMVGNSVCLYWKWIIILGQIDPKVHPLPTATIFRGLDCLP